MKLLQITVFLTVLLVYNYSYAQLCPPDNRFTEAEYFTDNQITSRLNVKYGSAIDWQGNTVDLRFDVYFPKFWVDDLAERPFILMIHGGGFQTGTKAAMTNYCKEFAKRGFVAATLGYRLGWDTSDPISQLRAMYRAHQDANAALRFAVRHANKARIDTDWMFIGGSSAGAITSLNVIYQSQADWESVYPGITNLLGGLDDSGNNLNNTFDVAGVFNNWGMTATTGITPAEMVPSVAFHGVLDQTTPIGITPGPPSFSGSGALHDALLANDVCSELTVDSLGLHGIYRGNDGEDFRVKRATCFFKSLFCDNCVSDYLVDSVAANCAQQTANLTHFTEMGGNTSVFGVYPNPADDLLNFSGDWSGYEVILTNAAGQVVRKVGPGMLNNTLDVADLTPGLYFLRAKRAIDDSGIVRKIVIQ
ncbi:MAG: T9SS type A sorting domain-containing protein [Bacteroidota bacterium]